MAAGFERLAGQLNLITQAQATVAKDVEAVNARVTALEARVAALEERRWPLGPMAAAAGVLGALVALATWLATR